tara:strand:- start:27 stop:263 length:237 start_codon:yes stop_codon:yes gene_type:complete
MPPKVMQDLNNFEPGELIVKLKDNTDFLMDFTVYSSIGQKISEGKTEREINISELQSGVYYFRFKKDNQTTIRKVIKN